MTIWSQDLNNLLPFYRDTLGLKVSMQDERFVAFGEDEGGRASASARTAR